MKCRRLTTSPGRLFRSLKGVSRVFVSTFSKTTSSSDLFFTLCKEEKKNTGKTIYYGVFLKYIFIIMC